MSLWVRRGGILALLLFSVSSGRSEISDVQILGVSNVQALLGFAAPAEADCRVAVSESASFDPLVNDVNPVLFAGAESVARAGNIGGAQRVAIIGKRGVEQAQDQKWYSRALQADTQHYYRISCGADTVSGTFRTANLPVGITYPWPIPQDPATGDFRWPSIDSANRAQTIIDPNYGTLIRRVSIPADVPGLNFRGQKFAKASGANWNNPGAGLADDGSAATYSGSGQDWLVLTDPAVDLTPTYEETQSIDWVTVSVKGTGSVEACLTLDGVTCHGQIRGVTLNGASAPTVIGSGSSGDTWGDNLWTYDINARRNKLFGVMLRARQGAGPVTIQYASLSLALGEVTGMPTAGSFRTCSPVKSNGGFHCSYIGAAGASVNNIYWIHPDTGEVRFLGRVISDSWGGSLALCAAYNALWDASDPNVYYCSASQNGKEVLIKGTYLGNDVAAAPGSWIDMRWVNLTPSPNTMDTLIQAFDPEFDTAGFGCGLSVLAGHYGIFRCLSGGQNSVGWIAALDIGSTPPRVVAASKTFAAPASRWCGIHALEPIEGIDWIGWGPIPLSSDNGGPFTVTLTSGAPAATGRLTLQVGGEPKPALMNAAVGDYFQLPSSSGTDLVRIVQKNSATEWVVERGVSGTSAAAQPSGAVLTAYCSAFAGAPASPSIYWSFLADPQARDASGKTVVVERVLSGNHMVQRGDYRLQEWWLDGYQIVTPGAPQSWNAPITYTIPSNPKWGGSRAWLGLSEPAAGLEGYQSHPSYENYLAEGEGRNNWFVDLIPFVGSYKIHAGVSPVAGQSGVYKVGAVLHRDLFPTVAVCGGRQLKDTSPGPITDGSTYAYCVGAGCAESASDTDVFVSCPAPVNPSSRCNENFYGDDSAVCVSDLAPYGQALTQFFFDPSGARNRVLTNGLLAWHSPRTFMTLDTPSPLPDGSWVVFPSFANSTRRDLYMVKVPPQPAFDLDPATNAQPANVTVTVNTPDDANIRNTRVQFGATPDLGSASGVQPCGASAQCTVSIPARPLELLYTKPVYLDDSNNRVGEGAMSVQIANGGGGAR